MDKDETILFPNLAASRTDRLASLLASSINFVFRSGAAALNSAISPFGLCLAFDLDFLVLAMCKLSDFLMLFSSVSFLTLVPVIAIVMLMGKLARGTKF